MKNKIYQVKKSVLLPDTPYIDQARPRILLLTKLDLIPRGEFLSPCGSLQTVTGMSGSEWPTDPILEPLTVGDHWP